MGLEASTYISGLTATWPVSNDPKSQGDDHLRLLKGVLQNTFPNANGPLYFPSTAANTSGTLAAAAQNQTLFYDTSGGNFSITLPSSVPAGWRCEVMKYSGDANAITVSPPSGSISTPVGSVATVRVGAVCSIARFIYSGSGWFCSKDGPLVGTTVNWDGTGVPAGHLVLDGTTFSSTAFAELFLALGTATLRDKRGRVDIGAGTGSGLSARVNGTAYGAESQALALTNLPNHTHTGTTGDDSPDHTHQVPLRTAITSGGFVTAVGTNYINYNATEASGGASVRHQHGFSTNTLSGANATAFGLLQPSVGTQKLIRAC